MGNSTPISRRFGWLFLRARAGALTAQALSAAAPLFSTAGACSAHAAQLLTRRTPVWGLMSSARPMVGLPRAALCSRSDAGAADVSAACKARRARSAAEKAAAQALLLQDDHRARLRPFLRGGQAARACALHVALRGAVSVATAAARRTRSTF